MKKLTIFQLVLLVVLTSACVRNSKYEELRHDYESLQAVQQMTDSSLVSLISYLDTLASSIDSIAYQEGVIKLGVDEDGVKFSKAQKIANLNTLEDVINRQRDRIRALEEKIQNGDASLSQLKVLISNLYEQLDEKEKTIASMRKELEFSKIRIQQLSTEVSTLTQKNSEQDEIISMQQAALSTQDAMLNTGYVLIGSRKELAAMKILGAIGNKINIAALSPDSCVPVDIREFTEISVNSKGMTILTQVPSSSYNVLSDGKTTTLKITDVAEFWSKSQFLIILTK